jgi:oligoendopeptidase F
MQLPHTDILEWQDLEPEYEKLRKRELDRQNVYSFLLDWSELVKGIDETRTFLSISTDLNTADSVARERLSHFYEATQPKVSIANAELRRKVLKIKDPEMPVEAELVLKRMRTEQEAYREENVQLEADHANLMNEHGRITGNLSIEFEGERLTVPQIEEKLREPNRRIREQAWRALQASKQSVTQQLDDLFLKLLDIRRELAKNAGLPSYRELIWLHYHRYDYTPQDCYRLHESIEQEVVPFATELLQVHRAKLNVETLQPWDFYWRSVVDPDGLEPIRPFNQVSELETGIERIFTAIDPELGHQFGEFRNGFMDLGSRQNKMSHAYCELFPKHGMPFVLQNVVGTDGDVRVTLHEFGHAFHGYASMRSQPLVWNYFSATEFVEVPSQAMEVLALPYLHKDRGGFYSDAELERVSRAQISQVVHLLTWIGFMDSFQHWIYAEARASTTIEEIDAKAKELMKRFMPQTDWSGFPQELGKTWQYYHIFRAPFYYIEYGLSWLGALQLWRNSLGDPVGAMKRYRHALTLGNSRTVPQLFEATGTKFAFDRATIRELMYFLRGQLMKVGR